MYVKLDNYHRPESVPECLALLGHDRSAILAGGTRLNVRDHEDLHCVVDIQNLPLGQIRTQDDRLVIPATTTLSRLIGAVPSPLNALAEAAMAERNLALRNRSTVGGRVCRNTCDGRLATALLALGAEVEVLSDGSSEWLELKAWLDRSRELELRLLTSLRVPIAGSFSAYLGFSGAAMAPPACDAALAIGANGVRVSSGGHASGSAGTILLEKTTAAISKIESGSKAESWHAEVRQAALSELPAHSDELASGDWRRDVAATLILRLVERWMESGGTA